MTYKSLFDTKEIKGEVASPKYDPFGSAAEPKRASVESAGRLDAYWVEAAPQPSTNRPATFNCPFSGVDTAQEALARSESTLTKIAEQQEKLNARVIDLVSSWDVLVVSHRAYVDSVNALEAQIEALRSPPQARGFLWFRAVAENKGDPQALLQDLKRLTTNLPKKLDPFFSSELRDALNHALGNEKGSSRVLTELEQCVSPEAGSPEEDRWARLLQRAKTLNAVCRMTLSQLEQIDHHLDAQGDELEQFRSVAIPAMSVQLTTYIQSKG